MPNSESGKAAREALIADIEQGGVTLVLGAGVSAACNVASWRKLATQLWRDAFGYDLPRVADDPRFYPFVFERVQQAMGEDFARKLRDALYAEHALPSREQLATLNSNTLAVLARVLANEAREPLRRIARVITLNVDDSLERAAARLAGPDAPPPLRPVVRASVHASQTRASGSIPVYHLHGYLRSAGGEPEAGDAPDVLVFTDMQYWASAAMASSHMNRTFSFALHDSHCVFVGMSMTDLNVWRWLALRAFEIATDCQRQCEMDLTADCDPQELYRRSLDRHYWITPMDAGRDDFLSECLALRGVRTVPIESWQGEALHELMKQCFPRALEG